MTTITTRMANNVANDSEFLLFLAYGFFFIPAIAFVHEVNDDGHLDALVTWTLQKEDAELRQELDR